ncbi:hypothetical protein [Chitinophaga sancti]|uniref:Uncharacterized protein n=1 Tax=Chitinophaga sancti TaxID=1004 RepID=A0A1K1SPK8_9BACT|nr:hypothetical protein [Chitinophaga sancti]WQD64422.1 hypothetical protein U0033_08435 [Chitinophaga sancti]WQG89954.1 hypothetical protein SR876_00485 [Chitinophaga sancti]SFW86257.1 hypothetical protein SAMN05661012_05871 [Chitinophaga sancti]
MKTEFSGVLQENLLFWNMWNIAYAYDLLEKDHEGYEAHFELLREMWEYCWRAVAAKRIDKDEFNEVFGKTYPAEFNDEGEFINPRNILHETYDDMREDVLSEFCITLLVEAFSNIYDGVTSGRRYGVRAGELPIEVIHGIVASNGAAYEFVSLPIVQNELAAQTRLLQDLSQPNQYTMQDRNIFRDIAAMQSMRFIDTVRK